MPGSRARMSAAKGPGRQLRRRLSAGTAGRFKVDAASPARRILQEGMHLAIKPFPDSIPSELPPAKLYLDDINEILQILTDSSEDCQASFVVGKSKCDTLEDLKDLRGRTTRFVLNICSPGKHQTLELTPSATRIHIHEIGDQLPAWAKYVNVAAIFEKRRLRLKSLRTLRQLRGYLPPYGWWRSQSGYSPRMSPGPSQFTSCLTSRPAFCWPLLSCITLSVRTALFICGIHKELVWAGGSKITNRRLLWARYALCWQ